MKVGDYVRIKDGTYTCIGKIKRFEQTNCLHIITDYSNNEDFNESDWFEWNIIKSSPNIIDLIEVGDYVNGYLVYEIKENCVMVGYKSFKTEFDNEEDFLYQTIYANNIKSIVTKEQFESMKYEVK